MNLPDNGECVRCATGLAIVIFAGVRTIAIARLIMAVRSHTTVAHTSSVVVALVYTFRLMGVNSVNGGGV